MDDSTSFSPEQLKSQLDRIRSEAHLGMTLDNLKLIFSLIDLTSLNTGDTNAGIISLCGKLNGFRDRFPGVPDVAAICVYPSLVPAVKENLRVTSVRIASVAAGFPSSQTFLEVKEMESRMAVEAGASEIDIVISVGKFLENDLDAVSEEIQRIKQVVSPARLKVILETGLIPGPADVYRASMACLGAGADFIKTSTGKIQPAATQEAVFAMCHAIKDFHLKTGRKAGIKPAGGIGTGEEALVYASIVRSVLGDDWLTPEWFRIGASRLANDVLSGIRQLEIGGNEAIHYF
jgi:deoxyribose-phosphate aldolase